MPNKDEVFPPRAFWPYFLQSSQYGAQASQIAVVMGSCTAGGAYVPAMSDETIMVPIKRPFS